LKVYFSVAHIFQKSRGHLKIRSARGVTSIRRRLTKFSGPGLHAPVGYYYTFISSLICSSIDASFARYGIVRRTVFTRKI